MNGYYIPERMMGGLLRYIEHGIPPGGFLLAVLENNLRDAVGRADEENLDCLPAFVDYLYNDAPSSCWGSPDRVSQWMDAKEAARSAA